MSTTSSITSGFSMGSSDLATHMLEYSRRDFYDRDSTEKPRLIRILVPRENRHLFCEELVLKWIGAHPAKYQPALTELMGRLTFFPQYQFERLLELSTQAFIDSAKSDEKYIILMENYKSNAWVPFLAKTLCPKLKVDKNIKPLGLKAAQGFAKFLKERTAKVHGHIEELNENYRQLNLCKEYKASLLALSASLQTSMDASAESFSQTDSLLIGMFSFLGREEKIREQFGLEVRPNPMDIYHLENLIEEKIESIQKACGLLSKTIVLFDDASYSGKQLCEHVTGIIEAVSELNTDLANLSKASLVPFTIPPIRPQIKIICPVISETALGLIDELKARNSKFRITLFYSAVCKNVGSCLSDANNHLIKELWGKASLQLSTMYFDHKLPNSTSFPTQIFRGSVVGQEKTIPFVRPYNSSCMLEPYKAKAWYSTYAIKDLSDTSSESSASSKLSVSTAASSALTTATIVEKSYLELTPSVRSRLASLSISPITTSSHRYKTSAAAEEVEDEDRSAASMVRKHREDKPLHTLSRRISAVQPFRDLGVDLFSPMRPCPAKLPLGYSLCSPSDTSSDASSLGSPAQPSVSIAGNSPGITLLLPADMARSYLVKREEEEGLKAEILAKSKLAITDYSEEAHDQLPLLPPLKASAEVVLADGNTKAPLKTKRVRKVVEGPLSTSTDSLRSSQGSRLRRSRDKGRADSLSSSLDRSSEKELIRSLDEALRKSAEKSLKESSDSERH